MRPLKLLEVRPMEQELRRTAPVRMRNYGRIIEEMVALASQEEDQEKQQAMVIYIAQCMRQKNAQWNKEQESGLHRLKEDIHTLSNGKLNCDFPTFDETINKLATRITFNHERPNIQKKRKK